MLRTNTLVRLGHLTLLGTLLHTSACGSDTDASPSGAGGGKDQPQTGIGGASTTTTGAGGNAGGSGGMVPTGDGNDGCREAIPLTESSPGRFNATSYLDPGDRDYFSFEAQEGEWFQIVVDPVVSTYDSVLRVFDADGSVLLASGDTPIPAPHYLGGTDQSKVFFRATKAGTYCLEALSRDDWTSAPTSDDETEFEVRLTPLRTSYELWNEDQEPNDTLTTPQAIPLIQSAPGRLNFHLGGVFDGPNDVDVYSIDVPTPMYLNLYPKPMGQGSPGRSGYGYTTAIGRITVHDAQQNLVAEMAPEAAPLDTLHCAESTCGIYGVYVEPGVHTISLERSSGATGDNDAYQLGCQSLGSDIGLYPVEGMGTFGPTDDGTNDTLSGAQSTFSISLDTEFGGDLPEGDVDYWVLDTVYASGPGDRIVVDCKSSTNGSSVNGFKVTYIDGGGVASDRSESETMGAGIGVVWTDEAEAYGITSSGAIVTESEGPHYIRVENDPTLADGPASDVHYRCVAYPL